MRAVQAGDRVRVHYVKRFQDGSVATSRTTGPLELTVGIDHPRVPGLGLALVGLMPGTRTTLMVPAEQAYGMSDPTRIRRLPRDRFVQAEDFVVGKWTRLTDRQGRCRLVRVLEVEESTVVVDTNHRGAGQTMHLQVKLLGIQETAEAGSQPI